MKTAVVNFRCPRTMEDKVRQNMRAAAIPIRMSKYFGAELIKREYSVPVMLRLKTMIMQIMKDPIRCSFIFVINHYCSLKAKESDKRLNAKWPIAWTTKKLL